MGGVENLYVFITVIKTYTHKNLFGSHVAESFISSAAGAWSDTCGGVLSRRLRTRARAGLPSPISADVRERRKQCLASPGKERRRFAHADDSYYPILPN